MKAIGWILLIVGIVMLLLRGISYTTKEKVVDAGPIEINRKENHTLTWPLYMGGLLCVVGIVMVVADSRKRV